MVRLSVHCRDPAHRHCLQVSTELFAIFIPCVRTYMHKILLLADMSVVATACSWRWPRPCSRPCSSGDWLRGVGTTLSRSSTSNRRHSLSCWSKCKRKKLSKQNSCFIFKYSGIFKVVPSISPQVEVRYVLGATTERHLCLKYDEPLVLILT